MDNSVEFIASCNSIEAAVKYAFCICDTVCNHLNTNSSEDTSLIQFLKSLYEIFDQKFDLFFNELSQKDLEALINWFFNRILWIAVRLKSENHEFISLSVLYRIFLGLEARSPVLFIKYCDSLHFSLSHVLKFLRHKSAPSLSIFHTNSSYDLYIQDERLLLTYVSHHDVSQKEIHYFAEILAILMRKVFSSYNTYCQLKTFHLPYSYHALLTNGDFRLHSQILTMLAFVQDYDFCRYLLVLQSYLNAFIINYDEFKTLSIKTPSFISFIESLSSCIESLEFKYFISGQLLIEFSNIVNHFIEALLNCSETFFNQLLSATLKLTSKLTHCLKGAFNCDSNSVYETYCRNLHAIMKKANWDIFKTTDLAGFTKMSNVVYHVLTNLLEILGTDIYLTSVRSLTLDPKIPTQYLTLLEWCALLRHSQSAHSDEDFLLSLTRLISPVKNAVESFFKQNQSYDLLTIAFVAFFSTKTVVWASKHRHSFRLDSQIINNLITNLSYDELTKCSVFRIILLHCHQFETGLIVNMLFKHFLNKPQQLKDLISIYFEAFLVNCLCSQSKLNCDQKCTIGMALAINNELKKLTQADSNYTNPDLHILYSYTLCALVCAEWYNPKLRCCIERCMLDKNGVRVSPKHVEVQYINNLEIFKIFQKSSKADVPQVVQIAILEFAIHLFRHVHWRDFQSADILTELCLLFRNFLFSSDFVIVDKARFVYEEMVANLTSENLNLWLPIHVKLMLWSDRGSFNKLCAQMKRISITRNEEITDADCESDVVIPLCTEGLANVYGILGGQYIKMNSQMEFESFPDKFVLIHKLEDALRTVVANLVSLSLEKPQCLSLQGCISTQFREMRYLLRVSPFEFLHKHQEEVATAISANMKYEIKDIFFWLERIFEVNLSVFHYELVIPIFIALVFRGSSQSNLRIHKLVAEISWLARVHTYTGKVAQLCVIPVLIVSMFINCDDSSFLQKCIKFLEQNLNMPMNRILRLNDISRLLHYFIQQLHKHPEAVEKGLSWISSQVLNKNLTQNIYNEKSDIFLSSLLSDNLCGILANFDNILLNDSISLEERVQALGSVTKLMSRLSDKVVSRMRAKFLTTLKIGLRYKTLDCSSYVVDLWTTFTKSLEVEYLPEMLPDLLANLIMLYSENPTVISESINTLLVTKCHGSSQNYASVFFLPWNLSKLSPSNDILNETLSWRAALKNFNDESFDYRLLVGSHLSHNEELTKTLGFSDADMHALLNACIKALGHASRSVRRQCLSCTNLLHCMRAIILYTFNNRDGEELFQMPESINEEEVLGKVQKSSSLRALLGSIMGHLLLGLNRDHDPQMRLLYAQWIGTFGPIDPSRLPNISLKTLNEEQPGTYSNNSEKENVFVSSQIFSYHLLLELAKIYMRAASPKQLDSTALSIQELLSLFEINPELISKESIFSSTPKKTGRTLSAPNASQSHQMSSNISQSHALSTQVRENYAYGSQLWSLFPEHIRDLFIPMVNSKYVMENFTDWSNIKTPIFTSSSIASCNNWIRPWCGSLVHHIKDKLVHRMLQLCEHVIKADSEFARFVLNHAALQIFLDGSEKGCHSLTEEMIAALSEINQASEHHSQIIQEQDVGHLHGSGEKIPSESNRLKFPRDKKSSHESKKSCRAWQNWYPLAAQVVFQLKDNLEQWLYTKRGENTKAVILLREMLSQIPHSLIAQTALRCGNLTRALLHWELDFFEDPVVKRVSNITGMAFMLRGKSRVDMDYGMLGEQARKALAGILQTYDSLHDSDGLSGILVMGQNPQIELHQVLTGKGRNPTFLHALELENEDQLELAYAMYEHGLSQIFPNGELEESAKQALFTGLFRCKMTNPSQLSSLLDRIGMLIEQEDCQKENLPQWVQRLLPANLQSFGIFRGVQNSPWHSKLISYRAEVATRLADWNVLKKTPSQFRSHTSWSTSLGNLLSEIKEKNWESYERSLDSIRLNQMTELSAAALEGLEGGYERAYSTSIIKLGLLTEIDWFAQLLKNKTSDYDLQTRQLDSLFSILNSRGNLSRPTFHTMEPIMATRHAVLEIFASEVSKEEDISQKLAQRIDKALGISWLRRAHIARKAAQSMAAYSCVLKAEAFEIHDALIERAKLLWQQEKTEASLNCLDKGIEQLTLRQANFDKKHYSSSILLMPPPTIFDKVSTSKTGISNILKRIDQKDEISDVIFQSKILRARYSEETGRYDFDTTRELYESLIEQNMNCEEAHFRLARYVDCTRANVNNLDQKDALLKLALKEYALALSCGSQFIYQSMPRLLSMWLDHGSEVVRRAFEASNNKTDSGLKSKMGNSSKISALSRNLSNKESEKDKEESRISLESQVAADQVTFKEVQELMRKYLQQVPVYQFYSALGQILSRMCHEHTQIVSTMLDLVVRLCEHCPHQTLWFLMSQHFSSVASRSEKCAKIFQLLRTRKPRLNKMISDYVTLCKHLTDVCSLYMTQDSRGQSIKSFSLKSSCKSLVRLIEGNDFTPILIPVHRQLIPSLPTAGAEVQEVKDHLAFGSDTSQIVLTRFDDNVDILSSQTRPKKMIWVGSDGHRYIIVAKPNDDMRKDCRLMELNTVINKFLSKNPETRRRALQIRTFAVIPLSEKGGLVEWVSRTQPLRTVLVKYLTEIGHPINWGTMVRLAPNRDDPIVFHMWLSNVFRDPSSWYSARNCYARSLAVMSMVGYVLGLGDRHTENILLDSTNGAVVHVDFSCVFNYGLTLPWPERVPFRLTRNLVHALGPTGYEGVFRKCCEAVMRLLRDEIDPIMAVFRPIYHDALVEQGGSNFASRGAQKQQLELQFNLPSNSESAPTKCDLSTILATNDRVAKAAAEKLSNMENRLRGKITEHEDFNQLVSMSVEGQVDELIHEATDVDRLCRMYRGWMPFL